MVNPRLANRYAKSLIELAIERGELEEVYKDMQFLQTICAHRELLALLRSPVVNPDKKLSIITEITANRVSELTASFNRLLIKKGREGNLPGICEAFIIQYKEFKHIRVVKLITATPVSEEMKKSLIAKVGGGDTSNIEIISEVRPEIIGGFIIEAGNSLVDASVAHELSLIKKKFMNNDFIHVKEKTV